MAVPTRPLKRARTRSLNELMSFLTEGLLIVVIVAAVLRFVIPSFNGWYHEDDTHNMRWVLEYRSEPWRALTERHALHDHIRPMTLMTIWLGSYLSNGAFWGPHLVQTLLHLGGLAGLVVLARDIGGSNRAGLFTALFAISAWGFERMLDWNAWTCSAGEVCFGFWALVAARKSLDQTRWIPAMLLLMAVSALYKEPGSVVYPLGAAAMALRARADGIPWRRAARLFLPLAVGVATFAFTFHAANVTRMGQQSMALSQRMTLFIIDQTELMINGFPSWGLRGARFGAGIPLFIFVAVLVQDLIGRELVQKPMGKVLWIGGAFVLSMMGYLWVDFAQSLVFPGTILCIARNYRRPPPGLVIYLAAVGVMIPFSLPSEVQLLAGSYGLALYVGLALDQMLSGLASAQMLAPGVAMLSIAVQVLPVLGRTVAPMDPEAFTRQAQDEHRVKGIGAVARALGVSRAMNAGMSPLDQEVLPLVGVTTETGTGEDKNPPTVGIPSAAMFAPARGAVERAFLTPDRIQGLHLPVFKLDARGNRQNNPGITGDENKPASLDVEPGYYALGVGAKVGAQMNLTLNASDLCGNSWSVSPDRANPVPFTVQPIYVDKGCGSIKLYWTGSDEAPTGIAFLSPLLEPIVSIWFPMEIERILQVRADQSMMKNETNSGGGAQFRR